MTRFWDGQTDGVTALLDLLSPTARQVKKGGGYNISLPISLSNILYTKPDKKITFLDNIRHIFLVK